MRRTAPAVMCLLLAGLLGGCGPATSQVPPKQTPSATSTQAAPVPAAPRASIPSLQIVDPKTTPTSLVQSGAKMKPGYKVLMTGASIVSVEETTSPDGSPGAVFFVTLDSAGGAEWAGLTSKYVGRQLAFVIGGLVVDAPQIADPIRGGMFTIQTSSAALAQRVRSAIRPQ
jgi:preprotein translocase subunit SecD